MILYILLTGTPPFDGDDEVAIIRKVKSGVYSTETKDWKGITSGAKDLVKKLMEIDPDKRITAREAVNHFWIKKMVDVTMDQ